MKKNDAWLYQKSDLKMSSNGVAVRGKKSSWFNGIITKNYTEYSGREIRVKHFHFLMLFMLFCISTSGNAQVRHTMLNLMHTTYAWQACFSVLPIKKLFCLFSYYVILWHIYPCRRGIDWRFWVICDFHVFHMFTLSFKTYCWKLAHETLSITSYEGK